MKSIVCIMGSPRPNGNSSLLVDAFCLSAEAEGANIKKYQLSELNYHGCVNLFTCKTTSDKCGQSDDLTEVLEAVSGADIVVLSSPIYFTNITGQLKTCLDRWFSFFVPDYPNTNEKSRLKNGKTVVLIQTQGEAADRYTDTLERYNHSFKWMGFSDSYFIQASGIREIGDIHQYPAILKQASELGMQLSQ